MRPLYFLPGVTSADRDAIAAAGLADLVDSPTTRHVTRGPHGGGGVLVGQSGGDLPSMREGWRWGRRFGGEAWIGFDPHSPPAPVDLVRPSILPGRDIVLGDGRRWTVPVLRSFDLTDPNPEGPLSFRVELPRRLTQDGDTGRLVRGDVLPRYAAVWESGCRIHDATVAQLAAGVTAVEADPAESESFVAEVMALNYRVGLPELALFGLLTDDTYAAILRVALDWAAFEDILGNRRRRAVTPGRPEPAGPFPPPDGGSPAGDPAGASDTGRRSPKPGSGSTDE